MGDAFLEVHDLTKTYGGRAGVQGLDLEVPRGSVLALLGPSGSGKTTTLRLLAGFERPDRGRVMVDGRDVTPLGAAARRFGMVFQHYALFPHLTVAENVAFGIAARSAGDRAARVEAMLALVDLPGYGARAIDALSGGQQQRVALARALAPEPRVLLLDEPLSNLDPTLRERTRRELKAALDQVGITTVLVTHEQDEAFALGDRIAVLHDGVLEQSGAPHELYDRPASFFVATFVGRAGVVRGTVAGPERVRVADGIVWPARMPTPLGEGTPARIVVRPEAARFVESGGVGGVVRDRRYTGARAFFAVETGDGTLEVEAPVQAAQVGARVRVSAAHTHAFRDPS